MALIDSSLEFSAAQALTATAVSTNVVPFKTDRALGVSDLYIVVAVAVAAVGTGTYSVAVQTDDNSGFSSPATAATLTIPATAKAGDSFWVAMPSQNEKFMRLNYTLGGTSPAVTVNAYISMDKPRTANSYPAGSAV